MQKFERFCQSCSMPLEEGKMSGTEKDGSKSLMYCSYCYADGAFLAPDMTLEEMKKVLDDTVGKKGLSGRFFAWMGKTQLPNLKRWKDK